jgi:DNA-binding transcriptional MerR regulator
MGNVMGGSVALRQSGEERAGNRGAGGAVRDGNGDSDAAALYSIGDLASETGITHRALRIYEEQGLLAPQRIGNQRIYSHRDRARLILVLRGKRLGFSLADIKEMLDLYDVDSDHLEQLRVTLKKARARIASLERQQTEIAETLAELRAGERGLRDLIREKDSGASRRNSVSPPPHPALSPPRGGEGTKRRSKS